MQIRIEFVFKNLLIMVCGGAKCGATAKGARKTQVSQETDPTIGSHDAVGMENVNSNSAAMSTSVTRKRKSVDLNVNEDEFKKKQIASPARKKSNKLDLNDQDVETAVFEEEGDRVQVEVTVDNNEFLSDGEIDSEHEPDEGGINTESQESLCSMQSDEEDGSIHNTDTEQTEEEQCSSSDSSSNSDSDSQKGKRKSKAEKRKQRRLKCKSMENKLDNLGSMLEQLQAIMVNSGMFKDQTGKSPNHSTASRKAKLTKQGKEPEIDASLSETTIYQNAEC